MEMISNCQKPEGLIWGSESWHLLDTYSEGGVLRLGIIVLYFWLMQKITSGLIASTAILLVKLINPSESGP